MLQLGKVQLLGDEMMRLGVDICGLSEVRWNGQGHFTTQGYEPISDRVLVVRLKAKPRNITLIQVYGPTTAATDEEMETFCQDLSQAVKVSNKSPRGTCCL